MAFGAESGYPIQRGAGGLTGRSIVLDAGHGGIDTGARFPFRDGFRLDEKDLTLDITERLGLLLRRAGATVDRGPHSRRQQIARGHLRGILNDFEQR